MVISKKNISKKTKAIGFFIYIVLLGITIYKHEPWFDEAQAWLLARDASFWDLMSKYLRYEGSPGLWHLVLFIPAKFGMPYITLNIISGLLAIAGTYLFIKYSPFPFIVKVLYPFSFFAFYQYGVVSRSYSLIPVLMFSVAILYKNKMAKPFTYFITLILLCNVCFHGLIVASSLAFLFLVDFIKNWSKTLPNLRIKIILLIAAFGLIIMIIKLQLNLPPDLINIANFNKDLSNTYNIGIPILLSTLAISNPSINLKNSISLLSDILSKFTIILSLYWLILSKKLIVYIMPVITLLIFFTLVYVQVWHIGTLFYTWIFAIWISYDNFSGFVNKASSLTKHILTAVLTIILVIQSTWSLNSIFYDFHNPYSGSKEVANYIKTNALQTKKIYATNFHSISILPYFSSNIYINYNNHEQPSFWFWSTSNSMYNEPYLGIQKYDPDVIILGIKSKESNLYNISNPYIPDIPNYKFLKAFTGALFWKDNPIESDSFILYEKSID